MFPRSSKLKARYIKKHKFFSIPHQRLKLIFMNETAFDVATPTRPSANEIGRH